MARHAVHLYVVLPHTMRAADPLEPKPLSTDSDD